MQYKDFRDGIKLSRLGMGIMRLPINADKEGKPIDYEKAKAIIDRCMAAGINYYDTAYIYHSGKSEEFTGRALAEYPRETFYVADKYNIEAEPDYRKQFPEQLARLNMDYIDFYLLHGIMNHSVEAFLTNGCIEYFENMRADGKIRYLGFSFHGDPAVLKRILAAHKWDFVQIQLNYYDWLHGNAKELYEILDEAGIPIIVMEPVRGGLLAKSDNPSGKVLTEASDKSCASWAMRFVKSLNAINVVLSGMGSTEMVDDNVATFSDEAEFAADDMALVEKAADALHQSLGVPCTACRYCVDDCPMNLDIPRLLATYNSAKLDGAWRFAMIKDIPEENLPKACISCGACSARCPQSIDIPTHMAKMAEMMNNRS